MSFSSSISANARLRRADFCVRYDDLGRRPYDWLRRFVNEAANLTDDDGRLCTVKRGLQQISGDLEVERKTADGIRG